MRKQQPQRDSWVQIKSWMVFLMLINPYMHHQENSSCNKYQVSSICLIAAMFQNESTRFKVRVTWESKHFNNVNTHILRQMYTSTLSHTQCLMNVTSVDDGIPSLLRSSHPFSPWMFATIIDHFSNQKTEENYFLKSDECLSFNQLMIRIRHRSLDSRQERGWNTVKDG